MSRAADFEIGLHRRDGHDDMPDQGELEKGKVTYTVETRLLLPAADAVEVPHNGTMQIDLEELRAITDDKKYGERLGTALLANQGVSNAFSNARALAAQAKADLRVRLLIGETAPELHTLRWETTCDPENKTPLFTGETLLFSRYVISGDWRPLRPKADLRAYAFIANPSDIANYPGFTPVRVETALAGITKALGPAVTSLADDEPATLNALLAALLDGIDVLYIVAHGKLVKGEAKIYLQKEDGTTNAVSGKDLVARISELKVRPRLIVLGSCQSAGTPDQQLDEEEYMKALGPSLAASGIPAVVAMQGNVTMDTEAQFMGSFFEKLHRYGVVDQAVSLARAEALNDKRPDWWAPVLFSRLKSGRAWYVPGWGDDSKKEIWDKLIRSIALGKATAILGSGLNDSLTGTSRDTARALAEKFKYPLVYEDRELLPQVAQYIKTAHDASALRQELIIRQWVAVLNEYKPELDETLRKLDPYALELDDLAARYEELLEGARQASLKRNPREPYSILAGVDFKMYLSTNPDQLLTRALEAADRRPNVAYCRWNDDMQDKTSSDFIREEMYQPTKEKPLVYHLFGELTDPDSMVTAEDDYFNYLIGTTADKQRIPDVVKRALAASGLFFLGFRLDDWAFRVVMRSIMNGEGRKKLGPYTHVAAQIDPEDGRFVEVDAARRFLEKYFDSSKITIYWGSVEDFLRELGRQWDSRPKLGG